MVPLSVVPGEIGLVHIVNEGAVASGVRRVEALTGDEALTYLTAQEKLVQDAAAVLKVPPAQLVERLEAVVNERRQLSAQVSDLKKQMAMGGNGGGDNDVETIAGVSFMGRVIDDLPAKDLRSLVDAGKKSMKTGIVVIVGKADGKAGISVGVTDDLTDRFSAVDLVRIGSEALGGKGGGGRPDMAQAGGPEPGKADEAVARIREALQS